MKKKALPLLALLASSFATTGVYAKVTYEDALNSQQELIESRRASAARVPTTGVDPREYQESGTTNEWRTIFSGSTTGSVQIPANATEVYVVSTEGARMFPASSPSYDLGTVEAVAYGRFTTVCVTATATGTYSNRVVRGQQNSNSKRCQTSSNHSSTRTATATFAIQSVMVK